MTKEEFFKLIRQEKREREITVTWINNEGELSCRRICEVKVNLTRNRIELFLDC